MIFGIGYSFHFNCLFIFLNSLRKRTIYDLGLVCAKDGATHSESFSTSITPNSNKSSTSLSKVSPCTFGTGYGYEHIGFASYFN